MSSINFYSYPLICALVLLVLIGSRGFTQIAAAQWLAAAALAASFASGWWIMRPTPSALAAATELEGALKSGKATLVAFESPY